MVEGQEAVDFYQSYLQETKNSASQTFTPEAKTPHAVTL